MASSSGRLVSVLVATGSSVVCVPMAGLAFCVLCWDCVVFTDVLLVSSVETSPVVFAGVLAFGLEAVASLSGVVFCDEAPGCVEVVGCACEPFRTGVLAVGFFCAL